MEFEIKSFNLKLHVLSLFVSSADTIYSKMDRLYGILTRIETSFPKVNYNASLTMK